MIVSNVTDRRRGYIGSWLVEPLVYDALTAEHVGRTVIYQDHGRAEAGTITSWRGGIVFARYSRGDTAAGARADDLCLAVRPLDTPEEIIAAYERGDPCAPGTSSYRITDDRASITFLPCGVVSHNPNDIANRYCAHCHRFIFAK